MVYRWEDIEELVKLRNEEKYLRWFHFLPKITLQAAAEEIENNIKTWSGPINILKDYCDFALVRKDTGEFIGGINLARFHGEEELNNIEIGYHIGQAYQGNGYATEAARIAAKWGLQKLCEMKAQPVILGKAEHENQPSRRVLEKAGFTYTHAEEYLSVYKYD